MWKKRTKYLLVSSLLCACHRGNDSLILAVGVVLVTCRFVVYWFLAVCLQNEEEEEDWINIRFLYMDLGLVTIFVVQQGVSPWKGVYFHPVDIFNWLGLLVPIQCIEIYEFYVDNLRSYSSFQMTVESNYVIAIATLSDWLKRVALVSQPMRSKTNRTMYAWFFPRFGRVTGDC